MCVVSDTSSGAGAGEAECCGCGCGCGCGCRGSCGKGSSGKVTSGKGTEFHSEELEMLAGSMKRSSAGEAASKSQSRESMVVGREGGGGGKCVHRGGFGMYSGCIYTGGVGDDAARWQVEGAEKWWNGEGGLERLWMHAGQDKSEQGDKRLHPFGPAQYSMPEVQYTFFIYSTCVLYRCCTVPGIQ